MSGWVAGWVSLPRLGCNFHVHGFESSFHHTAGERLECHLERGKDFLLKLENGISSFLPCL